MRTSKLPVCVNGRRDPRQREISNRRSLLTDQTSRRPPRRYARSPYATEPFDERPRFRGQRHLFPDQWTRRTTSGPRDLLRRVRARRAIAAPGRVAHYDQWIALKKSMAEARQAWIRGADAWTDPASISSCRSGCARQDARRLHSASVATGGLDRADEPSRRRYDSPVRRQKAALTRQRIVEAAAALVRESTSWTWDDVTFRTVAERAGVGESTVYRHFGTEQDLHDAVLHHLQELAGVSYSDLQLEDLPRIATQVFTALSGFAVARLDEGRERSLFVDHDEFRRRALLDVVSEASPTWSERDRLMAAATLDVLWNVPAYERLVSKWGMDTAEATATIRWAMGQIVTALTSARPSDQD